jgi:hypothetical protein
MGLAKFWTIFSQTHLVTLLLHRGKSGLSSEKVTTEHSMPSVGHFIKCTLSNSTTKNVAIELLRT